MPARALAAFVMMAACGGGGRVAQRDGRATTPPANPVVASDAVLISLERTSCFGWCPRYRVTITEHGRVEYAGAFAVKVVGTASASLPIARVNKLVEDFEAGGFSRLPSNMKGTTTDVPGIVLRYRGHEIIYSEGVVLKGSVEQARRDTVENLAKAVDRAVDIERWIGTEGERDAQFQAVRLEEARKICDAKPPVPRAECYYDRNVNPPP